MNVTLSSLIKPIRATLTECCGRAVTFDQAEMVLADLWKNGQIVRDRRLGFVIHEDVDVERVFRSLQSRAANDNRRQKRSENRWLPQAWGSASYA